MTLHYSASLMSLGTAAAVADTPTEGAAAAVKADTAAAVAVVAETAAVAAVAEAAAAFIKMYNRIAECSWQRLFILFVLAQGMFDILISN